MMVFETERLRMRAWTLDDLEAAHAIWGDAEVTEHLPYEPCPDRSATGERLTRIIESAEAAALGGGWAVVLKDSGEVIGHVTVMHFADSKPDEIEVGFSFRRRVWGMGFATEAVRGAVDHAFAELGCDRLIAATAPDNVAAHRVLLKAGFEPIGEADYDGFVCARYERRAPA